MASAAAAQKIKVVNPVVDLDGDEMTRWVMHACVLRTPWEGSNGGACMDCLACHMAAQRVGGKGS